MAYKITELRRYSPDYRIGLDPDGQRRSEVPFYKRVYEPEPEPTPKPREKTKWDKRPLWQKALLIAAWTPVVLAGICLAILFYPVTIFLFFVIPAFYG